MSNNDYGYAAAQRAYDLQEPPERKEMPYKCSECDGEIYEGDTIYTTPDGKIFCADCVTVKEAEKEY